MLKWMLVKIKYAKGNPKPNFLDLIFLMQVGSFIETILVSQWYLHWKKQVLKSLA